MRRIAALVLCALVVGSACSREASAAAATVNGVAVSTDELVEELNAIAANTDYIESLEGTQATGGGLTVLGSTPNSFDAAFVAQVLIRDIDYKLIHAEIANRKVSINDECRNQARNDTLLNLGDGNAGTGEQLFNKFPSRYQDLLVDRTSEVLALQAALSGQECGKGVDAEGYYNSNPEEFTRLCVSLIAVSDEATAATVVERARAGEDFAALAREVSIDPSTKDAGGDIGCRLPSEFNPTVAAQLKATETGSVLDPIPGQTGVSIVKVTDRQIASLDEVRSLAEELASGTAGRSFSSWLQQARASAVVTVEPRYGTFDPSTFSIRPPSLDLESSSPSSESSSEAP